MGIRHGYLLVAIDLELMSDYLNLIRDATSRKRAEVEARYQAELDRIPWDEISDDESERLYDYYNDDLMTASVALPQYALLSFVVMWYAFVERRLLGLCEDLNRPAAGEPIDIRRLDRSYISCARRFLIQSRNYEIDPEHWQELTRIRTIRNIIIHQGHPTWSFWNTDYTRYEDPSGHTAYVDLDQDTLNYMRRSGIDLITYEFYPSFEYCEHLVEFGGQFFKNLYIDIYGGLST